METSKYIYKRRNINHRGHTKGGTAAPGEEVSTRLSLGRTGAGRRMRGVVSAVHKTLPPLRAKELTPGNKGQLVVVTSGEFVP